MIKSILILAYMMLLIKSLYKNNNPLLMCLKMMMLIISISLMMSSFINSLIPMIMTMVMLGGILILYMFASTMIPNNSINFQKSSTVEKVILVVMSVAMMSLFRINNNDFSLLKMKEMVMMENNLLMLVAFMSAYFACIINILSMEKTSMRSYF